MARIAEEDGAQFAIGPAHGQDGHVLVYRPGQVPTTRARASSVNRDARQALLESQGSRSKIPDRAAQHLDVLVEHALGVAFHHGFSRDVQVVVEKQHVPCNRATVIMRIVKNQPIASQPVLFLGFLNDRFNHRQAESQKIAGDNDRNLSALILHCQRFEIDGLQDFLRNPSAAVTGERDGLLRRDIDFGSPYFPSALRARRGGHGHSRRYDQDCWPNQSPFVMPLFHGEKSYIHC